VIRLRAGQSGFNSRYGEW